MRAPCPVCGTPVAPDARFCAACGTKLEAPGPGGGESRKLVTVLFADVTGSTALGEQLDPEALRTLMTRYFGTMRAIIERHGGTVEKFIGDAVMAVFGIPAVHEDDALRAVRAAAEIRAALATLNDELEAARGIAIRFRTGINTGEVVAGGADAATTLVTGDAVNTAARLEQAAPPGEILLGRLTWSLVRDAVDAVPVEPIAAKGKADPVPAWRLVGVDPGAAGHARRLDAPIVGRDSELDRLHDAWERSTAEREPALVTVVAPAGVGKSRLVREIVDRVRPAGGRVLVGRCLSYGQGITYWPVRELVHAAAGITDRDDQAAARERLDALVAGTPDPTRVAARLAAAIGLSAEPAPQEEIFWAIRRTLEALAESQPTLVVLEDLHWAEDALLDLVDYVLDLAAGVPLLLLATARPDLLDRRPGFGSGRPAATLLRLEPLGAAATDALLASLPGGAAVPDRLRTRILAAAEGNPLYVEEFLGLLRDDGTIHEAGDAGWQATSAIDAVPTPPSIQALLAARLEALAEPERRLAQRASVIGRSFEVPALVELAPDAASDLTHRLLALVRKELLRPDRAELTAGDAFRFRHVLIRDAAYEALPKAERAALHERFAGWLEQAAGDRLIELEEILGYHLEQAYRYRAELGDTGDALALLGERAARVLAASGRRAADSGTNLIAIGFLERAAALPLGAVDRAHLLTDLYRALRRAGREPASRRVEAELDAVLATTDIPTLRAERVVWETDARLATGEVSFEDVISAAAAWSAAGTSSGDVRAHARATVMAATMNAHRGRLTRMTELLEDAREAGATAGLPQIVAEATVGRTIALSFGPVTLDDAVPEIRSMLESAELVEARGTVLVYLALAEALHGDPGWERRLEEGERLAIEHGLTRPLLHADLPLNWLYAELAVGGPITSAPRVAASIDILRVLGDHLHIATLAPLLAEADIRAGNIGRARELLAEGRRYAADEDVDAQCRWRKGEALLLQVRGEHARAAELLAEALAIADQTEFGILRYELALAAAEAAVAGSEEAAAAAVGEARRRADAKGIRADAPLRRLESVIVARG